MLYLKHFLSVCACVYGVWVIIIIIILFFKIGNINTSSNENDEAGTLTNEKNTKNSPGFKQRVQRRSGLKSSYNTNTLSKLGLSASSSFTSLSASTSAATPATTLTTPVPTATPTPVTSSSLAQAQAQQQQNARKVCVCKFICVGVYDIIIKFCMHVCIIHMLLYNFVKF